jgi:putative transposase
MSARCKKYEIQRETPPRPQIPAPPISQLCRTRHLLRNDLRARKSLRLTPLGNLVLEHWQAIPSHFSNAKLHSLVVMPSHLHGLIELSGKPTSPVAEIRRRRFDSDAVPANSLPAIVRSFKAIVARRAHRELGFKGELWHRNYFERIIRDGREFANATQYIIDNPTKWEMDRLNPEAAKIQ